MCALNKSGTCSCEIWGCLRRKHKHHYSPQCDTVWVSTALFFMFVKSDFTSMKIKAACSSETSLICIKLHRVLSHEMPIFQTHGRCAVIWMKICTGLKDKQKRSFRPLNKCSLNHLKIMKHTLVIIFTALSKWLISVTKICRIRFGNWKAK